MVFSVPNFDPDNGGGKAAMFFAGLILLIPHRIGMSRVNYVIKRYNLPISRAGLLLYKYHNNIELSLTIGTLCGNIIVWTVGDYLSGILGSYPWPSGADTTGKEKKNHIISVCMSFFIILMLFSSIYMFIIYVSGGDYGHLNAFYFSLIFLTLFDGFANAFAFAINGINASLLSAGIPLSGLLITLLHYMYKFFSDLFLWDDFDYYVLRLQLFLNIIQISIALGLWLCFKVNDKAPSFKIEELFTSSASTDSDAHICDWCPIFMLAISLGTVYAFYPSIAPYSIIDFHYASIIELWILIISSLLPLLFALLDTNYGNKTNPQGQYGPSGKYIPNIPLSTISFSGQSGDDKYVNFLDTGDKLILSNIQVKHDKATGDEKDYHGLAEANKASLTETHKCPQEDPQNKWHKWDNSGSNTYEYTLTGGSDKYYGINSSGSGGESKSLNSTLNNFNLDGNNKPTIKYAYYSNWFQKKISSFKITAGTQTASKKYDNVTCTINTSSADGWGWNCVWICAIFYILCIQIFMSLLHYPDSILSCFFNNPRRVGFISVLFNTLRELLQACGFAGAGKQCTNFNTLTTNKTGNLNITSIEVTVKTAAPTAKGDIQLTLTNLPKYYKGANVNAAQADAGTSFATDKIKATVTLPHYGYTATPVDGSSKHLIPSQATPVNGSIAATNKLITLFVMMFCVFTGDGYLQHYRRCCRDNWPTTGYNKYQSFFYWLRYGFKGGIKSITSSFTDLYYHNLRPQFISYA